MTKNYFFTIIKKIIFGCFVILIITITLLLYQCGFFQPHNKVIEYQEEVKLSDGSFIWVDIKRHYVLSGGVLGDAGAFTMKYKPTIIEISWDTEFEGVGRQSVFFDERVYIIDKIDEVWYVVGYRYPYEGNLQGVEAVNCRDVGYLINRDYHCVFNANNDINTFQKSMEIYELKNIKMNILDTDGLKDWGLLPQPLNKTRLSWSDKLKLQKTQPTDYQIIGKPYSYLAH